MRNWVVFLGGGNVQRKSIEIAREMGLRVVVVDRNPRAVGLRLADLALNASAVDVQAIYNFLAAHSVQPKVFFGNNDFAISARTILSEAFGLHDVRPTTALRILNKLQFRQDLVTAGLEDNPTLMLTDPGVKNLGFPAVIKPLTGGGSQGVRVIQSFEELPDPLSLDEPYVVEKRLVGYEVGLNGFVDYERRFYLAGGVLRFFGDDHLVPLGTTTSFDEAMLPELEQAYAQFNRICRMYDLIGPAKADFLIEHNSVPHALEVSPRFHGEVDSTRVIPRGQGLEPVREYFRYMTTGHWGGQMGLDDYVTRGVASGYCSVFASVPGYIEEIDVRQIQALPEVWDVQISRQPGDWVHVPPESTYDIVGYVYYGHEGTVDKAIFRALHERYNNLCRVRSCQQKGQASGYVSLS